jgi:cytoskeletal protein CcmA (bactofilin family)
MSVWKKDASPESIPAPTSDPRRDAPAPDRSAPRASNAERATIGRSITIRGEVTGDEDLLIQGRVDGSVDLKQHAVTVGADGDVKASIIGRVVTVEGKVQGNITADEQVILRSAAQVQGDITAPRVVLEDGARFRGGVDMGEVAERGRSNAGGTGSQARRTPEPERARETALTSEGSPDRTTSTPDAKAELTT